MIRRLFALILAVAATAAVAQQDIIELAREDIRAGRTGLVVASMSLTPAQQDKFWPLYREYADEQEELLDRRIAMLKEFAANRDSMDADTATSIAQQSFEIQRLRLERRERYFKRMSEALGPAIAARFLQVDAQISTLLDFEMMQLTPLLKPAQATPEE